MGRITKSPTVGTIEVGRREMIEQIESFHPASDHIPNDGKMVVGGDGAVKLRPGASALPVWLACGGRGHGIGSWPFQICAALDGFCRWRRGRGRCAPGFFVGNCDGWWREERASCRVGRRRMK